MKGKTKMQRESKKRGREVTEDKKRSEKCAKKMHQKNTTRPAADRELEEVVGVFDFPWIKDGTMFSTAISEDEWYFQGTFLSSLRAAIEDEGEFFSQFSCSSAGLMLEFLPDDDEIVDGTDNFTGDESSSSVPNVENSIWASVLNQPLGRV